MPTAYTVPFTLAVTDELATTGLLAYGRYNAGRIIVADLETGAGVDLTVYESDLPQGTFRKCDDVGTAGVLATIALDESAQLPTALAGCAWLKFVGSVAATLKVMLKGEA